MKKNYYALLVGINDYPDPFSSLNGCIKDIDNIESYLTEWIQGQTENTEASQFPFTENISIKQLGGLQILRLENQLATYENILKAFSDFLSQAKTRKDAEGNVIEDVIWFHFSGHGSEEFTAEELLELEPSGKDQTIVCYNASYGTGRTHLADKEIAVLLHNIAGDNPEESPHIVVSMDCCHSGSMTRFAEFDTKIKTRSADVLPALTRGEAKKKNLTFREIETYANGFYKDLLKNNKKLQIPLASHVLLSACQSVQLAGDLSEGGVFSLGLIDALKRAKNNINYSDLYMQTRTAVQKIRKEDQTPTFGIFGNFNAYRRFLDGSPLGQPDHYPLSKETGTWEIKCGAIHGIPIKSDKPVLMDIILSGKSIGKAELTAIGAQKSQVNILSDLALDPEKAYKAQLHFLPVPPEYVWIHGDKQGLDWLKQHWDGRKSIKWIKDLTEADVVNLEVEVNPNTFLLKDRKKDRQVFSWQKDENGAKIMVDCLAKMVNWERIIHLDHQKSSILSNNWVELEIKATGKNQQKPLAILKETQNHLITDEASFLSQSGATYAGFHPIWKIKNCDQNLYAYMFHLRSDYSILSYEAEKVYRPREHTDLEEVSIPMWTEGKGWGLGKDDKESTCYFKLIVCTEPLDYQQLTQSRLDGERLINWDVAPMTVKNDWCSITMKVRMSRP